jgi:hypothetical protein
MEEDLEDDLEDDLDLEGPRPSALSKRRRFDVDGDEVRTSFAHTPLAAPVVTPSQPWCCKPRSTVFIGMCISRRRGNNLLLTLICPSRTHHPGLVPQFVSWSGFG